MSNPGAADTAQIANSENLANMNASTQDLSAGPNADQLPSAEDESGTDNSGRNRLPTQSPPYMAPFIHHEGEGEEPLEPGSYMIVFHPGHSIAKHFAHVGREFELDDLGRDHRGTELGYGLSHFFDDELFELIRSDPGVKCVENELQALPEDHNEDGEPNALFD